MTMETLFEHRPLRWGLRGDPHLWDAMRAHLRGRPVPGSLFKIETLVEHAYVELTGTELPARPDLDAVLRVPRFVTGSGLSDGMVAPHFWRYTAIPMLIDRAAAATR